MKHTQTTRRELSDDGKVTVECEALTTKRKSQAYTVLMQNPDFQALLKRYGAETEAFRTLIIWAIKHDGIGNTHWHISYDLPVPNSNRRWTGVFSFPVPWLGTGEGKGYCNECGTVVYDHAKSCWSCGTKFAPVMGE